LKIIKSIPGAKIRDDLNKNAVNLERYQDKIEYFIERLDWAHDFGGCEIVVNIHDQNTDA
jgi:hypothetical protein